MEWTQVEAQWKQIKGAMRQKWGDLTDDDLETMRGNRDSMIGKLQERYGLARDRAQSALDEFIAALTPDEPTHGSKRGS